MPIRPRTAGLGAGVCLALLAVVWFAAFHIGFFGHADESIYLQFGDLHGHGRIAWVADHLVRLFDPNVHGYLVMAVVVAACMASSLLRGRPRAAVAVGVMVLGANVCTELLKHALAAPRPGLLVGPVSWPSGHSTAAMSLALAAVLAAPARLRPAVAAVGACFAIAMGYSVLATGIHYPSDVLGGFLMAATWALGAVAALLSTERWRPSAATLSPARVSLRAALGAHGAVLVAALVLAVIVLVSRPHNVVSYARAHEAFVVGAAGIAALGLSVSTGVLLSVRR